jgi:cytoskeletal protein CcmA (bactofilin family)
MTLKGFIARAERVGMAGELGDEAAPRPALPAAAAPVPRTVAPSTSVDASTEFDGKLRCKQTLRIDGVLKGEIECERTVLVGECAKVYASIEADDVTVAGMVEGDISARRKITLERTAVVVGNLTTPGIVIEEGAKLKGRIVIGADAEIAVETEARKVQALKKPSAAAAKPAEAVAASSVVATSA